MFDRINKLFAAIDRKDTDGFVSFLSEDASFRFANAAAVHNKENIKNTVASFFSGIKGLQHHILGFWEEANVVICEGEVIYTLLNGRELTLPFVNILRTKANLIADYRIYIDISALGN